MSWKTSFNAARQLVQETSRAQTRYHKLPFRPGQIASSSSIIATFTRPSSSEVSNFQRVVAARWYATASTKPTTGRKTTTRRTVKKTTPKRKVTKAKKKPASKAKPKRSRKVLTEKQKQELAKKEAREKLKALKAQALSPPKQLPSTAYLVFNTELTKEGNGIQKDISAKYKALTPSEMEHYNQIAHKNRQTNEANFQQWLKSYTPEQIDKANVARLHIRRIKKQRASPKKIVDHRHTKKPVTGYIAFTVEKRAAGDFDNIPFVEAAKLAGQEWKALSSEQKKKYNAP